MMKTSSSDLLLHPVTQYDAAWAALVPRRLAEVHLSIVSCERCPRLRSYCRRVAQEKKRAHRQDTYWGRPVPGFGDPEARLYLKETLLEARDATRNWKVLGQRFNMAFTHTEEGRGTLGKLLFDEELYQRMTAFVDDVHKHPWKLLARPKKSDAKKP